MWVHSGVGPLANRHKKTPGAAGIPLRPRSGTAPGRSTLRERGVGLHPALRTISEEAG